MGDGRDASFPDREDFFEDQDISCESRGGELIAGEFGTSLGASEQDWLNMIYREMHRKPNFT